MSRLRFFQASIGVSLLLWFTLTGLLVWRVVPVIYKKTAVPLHYNIHIGVDDVGPWWRIFTVPAIGLIFILLNLILARFMWSRDPMLAHVAAASTVLIELILLAATVFIILNSLSYA